MLGGTDLNLTPLPLIPVGVGGIFCGEGFLQGEAEGEGDSFAVGRVGAVAVADVTLLDEHPQPVVTSSSRKNMALFLRRYAKTGFQLQKQPSSPKNQVILARR